MIRELEDISYEEKLREVRWFRMEKRRLQGNLTVAFQFIKGAYKDEDRRSLRQPLMTGQGAMVVN